mmetsp:Transcript_4112/g.8650  ORF Transcript_4112/g.8650 Transcript_4112/m.8650 type:complete len:110 (-) Transcript_4112:116-445(-)
MVTHEKLYELLINCICIPQPQLSLLLFFLKINTSLQLLLNFIQSTSLFVDLDNSYYHQPHLDTIRTAAIVEVMSGRCDHHCSRTYDVICSRNTSFFLTFLRHSSLHHRR